MATRVNEQPAACETWQGTDVDVGTIERQLSNLWTALVRRREAASASRTSVYNLVVYTDSEEAARQTMEDLSSLSQRRPSRAIVLVGNRLEPRSSVDVDLSVQCHPGVGGRALCHEQLLIRARGRVADHLASLVVPLLVPELPVYLWWPGQPPFGHRTFHRLLDIADQLLIDSAEFASPGDGLANIARLAGTRHGVGDFHWERLSPWREIIAQFFDPPSYQPYARGIRKVQIEFGSGGFDAHRITAGVLLLLGWTAHQLGWEPETSLSALIERPVELAVLQGERLIPIEIDFKDHGPTFAGGLLSVTIVSQPRDLPPGRFIVERDDNGANARATVEIHEQCNISRMVPMPARSEAEILGDELDAAGRDGLYGVVVDMASRLAGREVWIPK